MAFIRQHLAVRIQRSKRAGPFTIGYSSKGDDDSSNDETVKLGTSEYYSGFISRPIDGENEERVTGDKILGPTLKFVASATGIIVFFTLAFLVANGLLF